MTEEKPKKDANRFIKYTYSMSDSDWAIEQFFRDMEFGNPELLQNDYYMALRSTMREKADPSEREPRVDLVSLLDNSGKPKLSDVSSVQIKRQSYMEMIAKDPGSMYDLSIYEETSDSFGLPELSRSETRSTLGSLSEGSAFSRIVLLKAM